MPTLNAAVDIYPINGACHDVAADATAFGHRDATYACVIAGMWPDPADNEANIQWVRDYYTTLAPHSALGGYVNFASADDQQHVRDNYGAGYDRLTHIKGRYDPANLSTSTRTSPRHRVNTLRNSIGGAMPEKKI